MRIAEASPWRRALQSCGTRAADLLLARACAACSLAFEPGEHPSGWCAPCLASVTCRARRCPRCALEQIGPGSGSASGFECAPCATHPPPFSRTLVLGAYAPPLDRIMRALKFSRQPALARPLAAALAPVVARELASRPPGSDPPVVVAIPLSEPRLAERGYNQSLLIARPIARSCGLAWLPRALQRVRAGPPQSQLSPSEREHNVAQAFKATSPIRQPVLLVDDVMTTGATLAAASRALLDAGAPSVTCIVVARTPSPDVSRRSGSA